MDMLQIKPISKRNAITTTVVSSIVLMALLMFVGLAPGQIIAVYVLFLAATVGLIIGIGKLVEPNVSLKFDHDALEYYHTKGHWRLDWDNIQRVDLPRVHAGQDMVELSFVAFRINQLEPFLDSISLRLASHILIEQRALLLRGYKDSGKCISCAEDTLLNMDDYKAPSGKVYKGLLAALAWRMEAMAELMGYQVYLPTSALDREPHSFINMVKQFQRQALVETNNQQIR